MSVHCSPQARHTTGWRDISVSNGWASMSFGVAVGAVVRALEIICLLFVVHAYTPMSTSLMAPFCCCRRRTDSPFFLASMLALWTP